MLLGAMQDIQQTNTLKKKNWERNVMDFSNQIHIFLVLGSDQNYGGPRPSVCQQEKDFLALQIIQYIEGTYTWQWKYKNFITIKYIPNPPVETPSRGTQ